MRGRICALGNGRGVLLPLEALQKLKLAAGSEVEAVVDDNGSIVIAPVTNALVTSADLPEGVDAEFASQVHDFIEQYRPTLKKLAQDRLLPLQALFVVTTIRWSPAPI